jgi:anti-sigma factor RsiW
VSTRRPSGPPARCLSLLERLSGYIDHELTPRQRRAIELHCRDCARCRMMVASLRRTVALCRSSRTIRLPARVRARARARIAKVLNELAEQ